MGFSKKEKETRAFLAAKKDTGWENRISAQGTMWKEECVQKKQKRGWVREKLCIQLSCKRLARLPSPLTVFLHPLEKCSLSPPLSLSLAVSAAVVCWASPPHSKCLYLSRRGRRKRKVAVRECERETEKENLRSVPERTREASLWLHREGWEVYRHRGAEAGSVGGSQRRWCWQTTLSGEGGMRWCCWSWCPWQTLLQQGERKRCGSQELARGAAFYSNSKAWRQLKPAYTHTERHTWTQLSGEGQFVTLHLKDSLRPSFWDAQTFHRKTETECSIFLSVDGWWRR